MLAPLDLWKRDWKLGRKEGVGGEEGRGWGEGRNLLLKPRPQLLLRWKKAGLCGEALVSLPGNVPSGASS